MAKKARAILDSSDKQELQNDINQKAGFRELTKAEFDALTAEEKNALTLYIITDEDEDEPATQAYVQEYVNEQINSAIIEALNTEVEV